MLGKVEKNTNYFRGCSKKNDQECLSKNKEQKRLKRDYEEYVADSTQFEEFKKVDHERKAAIKIRQETNLREGSSSHPLSLFKDYPTKACSWGKQRMRFLISLERNCEIY